MRWLVVLVSLLAVSAQDFNWGKKVKCFTVHGQVFCPGCNSRSGLSCPRRPENRLDFESCLPPSMLPPRLRPPLQQSTAEPFLEASSEVEYEESTSTVEVESSETEPSVSKTEFESTETFSSGFSFPLEPVMPRRRPTWTPADQKLAEEHSSPTLLPEMTSGQPLQQEVTTEEIDWQLMLYLYRMLRENKKRQGREAPPSPPAPPIEDDLETCNSNGDCPCPLICCRRGEGCPKKCVIGMLMPPPWG